MKELILFIMCFAFVFFLYQIFFVKPAKKENNTKKELLEIKFLESFFKLDLKKIKYEQLLQICAIVTSINISLTVTVVCNVNGLFIELIAGFISIFLLNVINYYFVYLFYKKKGMIKNGKHK